MKFLQNEGRGSSLNFFSFLENKAEASPPSARVTRSVVTPNNETVIVEKPAKIIVALNTGGKKEK
ncbi:hypothetical protein [Peribacillus sp. NPDC096540]|uniref:hypothetical protein n=1 Tax=Peribacillus sp. NPDC096540 TaxID=3390612 RepID=UPI003D093189